jgi:hypothetical protein
MLIESAGRFAYTGASRVLSWHDLCSVAHLSRSRCAGLQSAARALREELCTGRSRLRGTCAMRERRTAGWRGSIGYRLPARGTIMTI